MYRPFFRRCWLAAAFLAVLVPPPAAAQGLTVFAAASLTEAMNQIADNWKKAGHPMPRMVYAASSTLARQIDQGAPANLFASADQQWMDYLDGKGLLAPGTRIDLVSNRLVLIVPKDRARKVEIGPGLDLQALLGPDGRLATGDPTHVPVGIYAKEALTKLGLWNQTARRLAPTEDVRGALLLVERGEAPAGIVYATDAVASSGVAVAGVFPASSHPRITYPFAVLKANDTPEARALLAHLSDPEARAVFARFGFSSFE